MGDDDGARRRPEGLDVVEIGGRRGGRSRRAWLTWLPLVLVATIVVALVVRAERRGGPSATPTPHWDAPAGTSPSAPRATDQPVSPVPTITSLGRPMLGVTGGWELLGRGREGVVRIEFARGRVTQTPVPALASTGPVSFVVGRTWAIIRPLDFVPGYVVPDGQPARELTGALGRGGQALPGPEQAAVWVPAGEGSNPAMVLVDVDGRPAGPSIRMPDGSDGVIHPDATGYLLVGATGGVYLARPDGLRRVTAGTLVAIGPTRWLSLECDDRYRCTSVVTERATGAQHVLDRAIARPDRLPGAISPDGTIAAVLEPDAAGTTTVHLIYLGTGADRRLDVPVDRSLDSTTMSWSPDSRWLFVAGADTRLYPVEAATGKLHDLGVALPPISQLGIRYPTR